MMQHMRREELEYMPSCHIFHLNPDIHPTMRCKLINWLIECSLHFRLHRETIYLAVHYFDRYLMVNHDMARTQLQLIGIASLFIAAKLEVSLTWNYINAGRRFIRQRSKTFLKFVVGSVPVTPFS